MSSDLVQIIQSFGRLRTVVLGDMMLDQYSIGHSRRLCPEAPAPIVDVASTSRFAGGAANSTVNLRSLGADVTLISVVGADPEAAHLQQLLGEHSISSAHLESTKARSTLWKHRLAAGGQLIARLDQGSTSAIDAALENRIVRNLRMTVPQADLIVIADYGYGVLTPRVIDELARLRQASSCLVALDSKHTTRFSAVGVTMVKPNYGQAIEMLGLLPVIGHQRWQQIEQHGQEILNQCNSRIAAVTLDQEGAAIFEQGQPVCRTRCKPAPHACTSGAGDTYLAAFALALAADAPTPIAAELASMAASVVVSKQHTAACTTRELLQSMGKECNPFDLDCAGRQIEPDRQLGRRIVLTNGCFDILHRGHVAYLRQAKSLGDVLVVAVNSDDSIRRLKGPQRPINSLEDRLGVLSGLGCIDHLVAFDESTPDNVIRAIRPHVFVKGGDYTRERLPEASLVESLGGEVVILQFVAEHSTSRMIERIRDTLTPRLSPTINRQEDKHDHGNRSLGRRSEHSLR